MKNIILKKSLLIIMLLSIIFTSGCIYVGGKQVNWNKGMNEEEIICNSPYMRHSDGCCVDQNYNYICDSDEGYNNENNLPSYIDSSNAGEYDAYITVENNQLNNNQVNDDIPTEEELLNAKKAYENAYTKYNQFLKEKGMNADETTIAREEYNSYYNHYMDLYTIKMEHEESVNTNNANNQNNNNNNNQNILQTDGDVFDLPKANVNVFEMTEAYGKDIIDFDGKNVLFLAEEDYDSPHKYSEYINDFVETIYKYDLEKKEFTYPAQLYHDCPELEPECEQSRIRQISGRVNDGRVYWQSLWGISENETFEFTEFNFLEGKENITVTYDVDDEYFAFVRIPYYKFGCYNIYVWNIEQGKYDQITDHPILDVHNSEMICPIIVDSMKFRGNKVVWEDRIIDDYYDYHGYGSPLNDKGIAIKVYDPKTKQTITALSNEVNKFKEYDLDGNNFVYVTHDFNKGNIYIKNLATMQDTMIIDKQTFMAPDPMTPSKMIKPVANFELDASGSKVAFIAEYYTKIGSTGKIKSGVFVHDINSGTTKLAYQKEGARFRNIWFENNIIVFSSWDVDEYVSTRKNEQHNIVIELKE